MVNSLEWLHLNSKENCKGKVAYSILHLELMPGEKIIKNILQLLAYTVDFLFFFSINNLSFAKDHKMITSLCEIYFILTFKQNVWLCTVVNCYLEYIVAFTLALRPKHSMGYESLHRKSWDFMKRFTIIEFSLKVIFSKSN